VVVELVEVVEAAVVAVELVDVVSVALLVVDSSVMDVVVASSSPHADAPTASTASATKASVTRNMRDFEDAARQFLLLILYPLNTATRSVPEQRTQSNPE
jgi:hypothetical protein